MLQMHWSEALLHGAYLVMLLNCRASAKAWWNGLPRNAVCTLFDTAVVYASTVQQQAVAAAAAAQQQQFAGICCILAFVALAPKHAATLFKQ